MTFFHTLRLDLPYGETVERVRLALAEQGFGVLTEIDVRATMRAKLDAEMEDYVILGACNPALAHRALDVDRSIGLLLPCTVVVRGTGDGTVVEVMDPNLMATITGRPELAPIAEEADRRLTAALDALAGAQPAAPGPAR
jgi:uncharacterized protein (DUF302 family)